jgi:chromosome transmission fidelity protein 1
MNNFTQQLFPYSSQDKISQLSCDHIISTSNLLPLVLTKGLSGRTLTFKASQQSDAGLVRLTFSD